MTAATAYTHDSTLEHYDGFVVYQEGPSIYFSKVVASRKYMNDLFGHREVIENLPLRRSAPFNIYDAADRREIARMLVGIFRYMDAHKQSRLVCGYGMR